MSLVPSNDAAQQQQQQQQQLTANTANSTIQFPIISRIKNTTQSLLLNIFANSTLQANTTTKE